MMWTDITMGKQSMSKVKVGNNYATLPIYKNTMLRLSDREWICPVCGQIHDRDMLAANNILREGIHELESNHKTNDAIASWLLR